MNIEKEALALIEYAYDATMAPDKWQILIEKFIVALGANTGILREVNYNSGAVGLFSTVGYTPQLKQAYRDHFVHLDLFAPTLKQSPIGEMIHGDTAVPWSQQIKSEFYNDYMRPQGARYVLGATLARDSQHNLLFGLQRSKKQGDFTESHLKLIALVAPHIAKTMQIHRRIYEVTAQKHWALSALNQLKTGVILLNDRGHPLFINEAADQLMSICGCIIADDGVLLTNVTDTLRLQDLVKNAANYANGKSCSPAGGNIDINTPTHTMRIHAIPLPRNLSEQAWNLSVPESCVALFISTTGTNQLHSHTLMQQYGLTPAEARLTRLLAEGLDLTEISTRLNVSVQTARSQLKSVFAKTNVGRQAELVALLLSGSLLDTVRNSQ